jgi:CheY-like chemotaxis protein
MMKPTEAKVLLFEDDVESMGVFADYLREELGLEVVFTAQADAIDRLRTERFHLLLVDLMIQPETLDASGTLVENLQFENTAWRQTGVEFIRRLRAGEFQGAEGQGTSPNVAVLVLSAVGFSIEDHLPGEKYLEKPFRLQDATQKVLQMLEGAGP